MSKELRQALEEVARRFRQVRLWSGLALCWLAWALVGVALFVTGSRAGKESSLGGAWIAAFAALAAVSGIVWAFLALRSARSRRWVARRIEAHYPELRTGLLAAIEEDEAASGRLGFLQSAVIREALEHRRSHPWEETVSSWTLRSTRLAHALALGLLLVITAALIGQARSRPGHPPGFIDGANLADVQVDPGNTELERGSTLLVVARFNSAVPADARLVVEGGAHSGERRGMTRSLEDPTFAGRVESVETDLAYHIEFDGQSTETYRVKVFEYPALERTDAKLVFPQYTSLPPKTVEDIRHVTAVEGTELTLLCRLNKDVVTARLIPQDGPAIELKPREDGSLIYQATATLSDPRRYKVQLVDREGRSNKLPAEIVVNVTRNRPTVVKMTQPSSDVRVSPVEELRLKAQLEDDYGLVRQGLSYTLAGGEPRELVLNAASGKAPSKKATAEHLLDFEALHARPDQLVTYFFWAEDIGPDNQPRRTSGDMFFAEVRHFEEIFRQGEQPPGGSAENEDQQGGGNAQESSRLADLQKEIINGTWKLIRRETGAKPSAKFAEDAKLLHDSQKSAIEQAGQLAERLQDPTSKANLETATKFMKDAEKHLGEAVQASSVKPHTPALVAEQAAYQALLKLRAREFEVVRNNSRQRSRSGQASGGSPSQRQLNQLELRDDENRYEQQRSARAQQERQTRQEREQAENRQVMNRLRELAQRQIDLNDRVKELQSALEAAKTPQAREEIERQLKRLRDQQQQVLRDTDELRERMEREENRDRMADARQQVEESREHVRQASEALEEGRLSQAVTEGARAGRQMNDLREQLRKESSNRFSEALTEMRDQARNLDEDQKKLTEQLDAENRQAPRSLRDTREKEQVQKGLEQQGKRLDQLLDRMQNTVQEAEETEPLLAKGLFDTVRKANEQQIPDALKVAQRLADAGVPEEAAKASRHASQGLGQLREGVERAARGVLGDETAALKRAQGEVEDLADQIDREIARATGQEAPEAAGRRNSARPQTRQGRPGENAQDPQAQDSQQEGQPGEPDAQGQDQQGQPNQQGQQKGQRGQQGQPNQQGQQKGQRGQQGQANQQGQPGQQGGQPNQQGQPGQQGGQSNQQGQQGGQPNQQGQQGQQGGQPNQQGRQAGLQRGGGGGGGQRQPAGFDRVLEGLAQGPGGPITGEGFRQWSDRMRDVEELLENPDLRAEAARIRDRVRGAREEFKRHAKEPDWKQLETLVADPIRELRDRIAEEVRRRESPDALVPIDRDPVPPQFAEGVRRYYERLGSGQ
jgi:hypothetical protein